MKDYLKKYKHIDFHITYYQSRIKSFERFLDSTPRIQRKTMDQIAYYQSQLTNLKALKENIEQTVRSVPLPYRDAVYYRYIEGLTFREIAEKLHYSQSSIARHIDRGIKILETGKNQKK